jgi:hypothetical protein
MNYENGCGVVRRKSFRKNPISFQLEVNYEYLLQSAAADENWRFYEGVNERQIKKFGTYFL